MEHIMKLVRWGMPGKERPGLIDELGKIRDLSQHCVDISGEMLHPDRLERLRRIDASTLPVIEGGTRLGVPVGGIGNIICIGLNYRDHAAETGLALPAEPVTFSKHTGSLAGPYDALKIPPGTAKLDWEVELAVLIGAPAWQVDEQDALAHAAGYMTANDVSARDWQMDRGGQWVKGKSGPGFCPLGPWLVTADEIADPQKMSLRTDVSGIVHQNGNTADMVFSVAHIISYLSRFMPLASGDVILTGTPAGVGLGKGVFLQPGQLMTCEVQGLGRQQVEIT
jgi:2-keto-4-pentenoate hydratase/2-oxohepta-3-ene-1,7-dioic acid hydratase in catechol pathway